MPTNTELALDEEIPFIAEVIKGGRLTIPEEIRTLMHIEEGNYVLIKLKIISRGAMGKDQRNPVNTKSNGVIR